MNRNCFNLILAGFDRNYYTMEKFRYPNCTVDETF